MAKSSSSAPATAPKPTPSQSPESASVAPAFTNDFLKSAKIEVSERSGRGAVGDPVVVARHKIIQSIQAQKSAVQADIERKPFNPPGGKTRFSRWYYNSGGKYHSLIRYAQTSLVTIDEKPAGVLVGDKLDDLLPWYDRLTRAVEEGQFDDALRHVQRSRSMRMRGKPRASRGRVGPRTTSHAANQTEDSDTTGPGKDAGGESFLSSRSVIEARSNTPSSGDHW